MSKILLEPTEHGLINWFNNLTYAQKLFIYHEFRDIGVNDD